MNARRNLVLGLRAGADVAPVVEEAEAEVAAVVVAPGVAPVRLPLT